VPELDASLVCRELPIHGHGELVAIPLPRNEELPEEGAVVLRSWRGSNWQGKLSPPSLESSNTEVYLSPIKQLERSNCAWVRFQGGEWLREEDCGRSVEELGQFLDVVEG
jgi:hypothetical protein